MHVLRSDVVDNCRRRGGFTTSQREEMASERKPRLCIIAKAEGGFGFHLHGEKGKSGQFIRKVEPGSPAEASGLRAGDRVVAVNGVNVEKETHHQVVQRIKALENETRLLVVDNETHESLRSLRLTATEEMAVLGVGSPSSSSSSSSPSHPPSSVPSTPSKKRENGSVSKQPVVASNQVQKPTRRSPSKAAKKDALVQAEALSQSQLHPQSRPKVDPSELAPRLCHLARTEMGYGFNLHSDRSRPGQYIRSLDPGSPADHAGLRPQDRLVEVNGVNIEGMRHAEVVAFIKKGGDETWLLVVDPDTDDHFKRRGVVPSVSHIKGRDAFTKDAVIHADLNFHKRMLHFLVILKKVHVFCLFVLNRLRRSVHIQRLPQPQMNGSSTTQSMRSTRSDLSSQGNSTQVGGDRDHAFS
uniref:NHERF family PDZ scaffold protein 2 n=2 Tax=Labrus bergylta TaxID=56723 RepID=A0A3Q3FIY3_9LABR